MEEEGACRHVQPFNMVMPMIMITKKIMIPIKIIVLRTALDHFLHIRGYQVSYRGYPGGEAASPSNHPTIARGMAL